MKKLKKLLPILIIALVLIFSFLSKEESPARTVSTQVVETQSIFDPDAAASPSDETEAAIAPEETAGAEELSQDEAAIAEDGYYTDRDDVALYIHTYGRLPGNFVTKSEAKKAGWPGGGLDDYLPGMSIGGDRFRNSEGLLPDAPGRIWTECDINTMHARSRGVERIVFSNDGLIYYTDDHYGTFVPLYE